MIYSIKYLFPNAIQIVDFELRDDSNGAGPYIAEWNELKLGPRPTNAELQAAKVSADTYWAAKAASDAAKAELARLDNKSIRDIRAYLTAKADAPQSLKDYEAAAIAERVKVK